MVSPQLGWQGSGVRLGTKLIQVFFNDYIASALPKAGSGCQQGTHRSSGHILTYGDRTEIYSSYCRPELHLSCGKGF